MVRSKLYERRDKKKVTLAVNDFDTSSKKNELEISLPILDYFKLDVSVFYFNFPHSQRKCIKKESAI